MTVEKIDKLIDGCHQLGLENQDEPDLILWLVEVVYALGLARMYLSLALLPEVMQRGEA